MARKNVRNERTDRLVIAEHRSKQAEAEIPPRAEEEWTFDLTLEVERGVYESAPRPSGLGRKRWEMLWVWLFHDDAPPAMTRSVGFSV